MNKTYCYRIAMAVAALMISFVLTGCQFDIEDAYQPEGNPYKATYTSDIYSKNTQTVWFDRDGNKICSRIIDNGRNLTQDGAYNQNGDLQVIKYTAYDTEWKAITDTATYTFYDFENPGLPLYDKWRNWEPLQQRYAFKTAKPDSHGNWTELIAKDGKVWLTRSIAYYDEGNVRDAEIDSAKNTRDMMFAAANPPSNKSLSMAYGIFKSVVNVLVVVCFPTIPILMVFTFCWLLMFKKTRRWFNKRAGADIIPAKRLDPLLFKGLAIIIGFHMFVIPGFFIWNYFCKKRAAEIGKKAARWELIYSVCALYSTIICGVFLIWLVAIIALLEFLDKSSKSFSPYKNGDNDGRCCLKCSHYSSCCSNGKISGLDPSTHYCSDYN